MKKPGALGGGGGVPSKPFWTRVRLTVLLGKDVASLPPLGPKFTTAAGLTDDVTLKLRPAGRDGFGAGLVWPLPSGPNSRNNFVVVLALFAVMVISMVTVDAANDVMVWRSTVPDG